MESSVHTLPDLFAQLGLPSDRSSCESFLATHRLDGGQALFDAPFWTESQAEFLRECLDDDSDWCEAADELATSLTKH